MKKIILYIILIFGVNISYSQTYNKYLKKGCINVAPCNLVLNIQDTTTIIDGGLYSNFLLTQSFGTNPVYITSNITGSQNQSILTQSLPITDSLQQGNYIITATDAKGCKSTISFTINGNCAKCDSAIIGGYRFTYNVGSKYLTLVDTPKVNLAGCDYNSFNLQLGGYVYSNGVYASILDSINLGNFGTFIWNFYGFNNYNDSIYINGTDSNSFIIVYYRNLIRYQTTIQNFNQTFNYLPYVKIISYQSIFNIPNLIDTSSYLTANATYILRCRQDSIYRLNVPIIIDTCNVVISIVNLVNANIIGGNGSIDFTTIGGTAPFNYTINNTPQISPYVDVAGTYTIQSTDAKGCVATRAVTITEP